MTNNERAQVSLYLPMACKNTHSDALFFVRKEASISDPVTAGEVCKVAYHRSEIPIILDFAWRSQSNLLGKGQPHDFVSELTVCATFTQHPCMT